MGLGETKYLLLKVKKNWDTTDKTTGDWQSFNDNNNPKRK